MTENPATGSQATEDHLPNVLQAAGTSVSLTTLSPLELGDAISGLTLAVAGVGEPPRHTLPAGQWPDGVGPDDAWAAAVESATGWYVLLSQDCDIVRDDTDEPTILVAPLMYCTRDEWDDLRHNGYSSRKWAYPSEKFRNLSGDKALCVDLAWTTSVLKGALRAPGVHGVRPLTGPVKRDFSEWAAARTGRVPFPDDVVEKVLDPCYEVRTRLLRTFNKKKESGSPPLDARAVGAVERWFAHHSGRQVTFLGQLTGSRLIEARLVDDAGHVLSEDLEAGRTRLETAVVSRMANVDPHSGFQARVVLIDLAKMSAAEFVPFALLLR